MGIRDWYHVDRLLRVGDISGLFVAQFNENTIGANDNIIRMVMGNVPFLQDI